VDVLDREDEEEEHDGAGEQGRGDVGVEVGSGTALNG
jgi:hypothetical protein